MTDGGKDQTGRRPLRRERAKPDGTENPGVRNLHVERRGGGKDERGRKKGRSFHPGPLGGRDLRGWKTQESKSPRPEVTIWGA